ncbi:MAG: hypothetical protein LRS48_05860, partial [Desulfurococcales archaeon]|nr:hypothetical protein [Desulfurococcales archaeon]
GAAANVNYRRKERDRTGKWSSQPSLRPGVILHLPPTVRGVGEPGIILYALRPPSSVYRGGGG